MKFKIEGDYIELNALLKITGIAETGGQAGMMVEEGLVRLNGKTESRKRAKLRPGDVVQIMKQKIELE
ncbi:MAG: RNA-binding S4 domain-containing protein [Bacteroidia bacterium]